MACKERVNGVITTGFELNLEVIYSICCLQVEIVRDSIQPSRVLPDVVHLGGLPIAKGLKKTKLSSIHPGALRCIPACQ